jgi:uncharacterized protein YecA (UPF0149 family)
MALVDIQEKSAEERKREKRLVHFTNSLSRDFLKAKVSKSKTKMETETAEYITKSFLDYIFFNEHKEIREITDVHIQHFMLDYAPNKLNITKEAPDILSTLLVFLETEGHIKNGMQLSNVVKDNKSSFLKLIPKTKKTSSKKKIISTKQKKKSTKKAMLESKIGRNDPCPCGSGKKYKKCCGRIK